MRNVTLATIAAAGLTAAGFGLMPPSAAAPSDSGSAQDTIKALEDEGYTVIVNKVGNAPLSKCTVSATKPGHAYSRMDSGAIGDNTRTVVTQTINVYLSC